MVPRHTHDDPEERKHRSYSLWVACGALIVTAVFSWKSDRAQQASVDQAKASLKKQEAALDQQAELFVIQAFQNPQELWCSEAAKRILVETKDIGIDTTPKEMDALCEEVQDLPPSLEVRRDLISLLVTNPSERDVIIAAYHELYGEGARWINDIADLMQPFPND